MVQRKLLEQLGRRGALEVTARLASALIRIGDLAPAGFPHSALLPLVEVLLRWLSTQPLQPFRCVCLVLAAPASVCIRIGNFACGGFSHSALLPLVEVLLR